MTGNTNKPFKTKKNNALSLSVGSVCSGIEAASLAWNPLGFYFQWFSEIAPFPSRVLDYYYPDIPNLGDMMGISSLLKKKKIDAPDIICGGTPCQAFSFAGARKGLHDERGKLSLSFLNIITANDKRRKEEGKPPTIVFWENVEGVLSDKTGAFSSMVSYLAGFDTVLERKKWEKAGLIKGPKRNVAWRVLDAKYFGLPQQRKRIYLLAGGKDFHPERVLFEMMEKEIVIPSYSDLNQPSFFYKDGHSFEVFRGYTDCFYASYGTKWSGNAPSWNGSLFVIQDGRLRRLNPLEGERLMGFPDNYTAISGARNTSRYMAIGNSWAVPVIQWIGKRIKEEVSRTEEEREEDCFEILGSLLKKKKGFFFYDGQEKSDSYENKDEQKMMMAVNTSMVPGDYRLGVLFDVLDVNQDESLYLSVRACAGILRRAEEWNHPLHPRLKEILEATVKKGE